MKYIITETVYGTREVTVIANSIDEAWEKYEYGDVDEYSKIYFDECNTEAIGIEEAANEKR